MSRKLTAVSFQLWQDLGNLALAMTNVRDKVLLKKIAWRIKQLRTEREMTQEVFYYDTSIHIARIETGNLNISVCTLAKICDYLGVSLVEFFKGINDL